MKRKWRDVKAGDRVVLPVTESVLESRGNQLICLDDCDPIAFPPDAEVEVYDDSIVKEAVEFVKSIHVDALHSCPVCIRVVAHAPDCRLAAWLKRVEGK